MVNEPELSVQVRTSSANTTEEQATTTTRKVKKRLFMGLPPEKNENLIK